MAASTNDTPKSAGPEAETDVAPTSTLTQALASDPSGEAETARTASGRKSEGHDEATAAEAPEATKRLGDASGATEAAREAVERATAGLGKP